MEAEPIKNSKKSQQVESVIGMNMKLRKMSPSGYLTVCDKPICGNLVKSPGALPEVGRRVHMGSPMLRRLEVVCFQPKTDVFFY